VYKEEDPKRAEGDGKDISSFMESGKQKKGEQGREATER
jgi:hypothetical protein